MQVAGTYTVADFRAYVASTWLSRVQAVYDDPSSDAVVEFCLLETDETPTAEVLAKANYFVINIVAA